MAASFHSRSAVEDELSVNEDVLTLSFVEPDTTRGSPNRTDLEDDSWIFSPLRTQLPPEHPEWLRYFERSPDSPLQKSYKRGIIQPEVDTSAPIIRIGIVFMAGGDKPTVAAAEMSSMSSLKPDQKTPEWRVFTAANLLKRFVVTDDFSVYQIDASPNIMASYKDRKRLSKGARSVETVDTSFSTVLQQQSSDANEIPRNIQDYTLTVDSDQVELLHGGICPGHDFDITGTLVEVDLFSMRDLMTNYRTIVQSGPRNFSGKEILPNLDTMINDVRRLRTRSPRLFRMSTRYLIATSSNLRYGVGYGNHFVTLTTSEGIRRLVLKSTSYFLSLNNDTKVDQEDIRPKFLQMLVLLLSFLNNHDLAMIADVLESTFNIPGERASLELLIMKVLPLESINPQVFLEALFDAYKSEGEREGGYGVRMQEKLWEDL
jgi:hypothetical protein